MSVQLKNGFFALGMFLALFAVIQIFSFSSEPGKKNPPDKIAALEYFVTTFDIPKDISFAGEKIPTHTFDVAERLDKELLVNSYWQSQTLLLLKRAHRWFPVIEPILKKNNIPDDFKYLALAESGLTNVVSPAGATGIWQFMAPAGKKFRLEISEEVDERYNLEKSTEAACGYLNEAKRTFGNWIMAAASYNMGIEGLRKQTDKQRQSSYFDLFLNEETSRYIYRLAALKEIFSNPEKYGFKIQKKHLYPQIPVTTVIVDSSIANLVDFAQANGISYKALRTFNPWLRQYTLTNKERKKYAIKIPSPDFDYRAAIDSMTEEEFESD